MQSPTHGRLSLSETVNKIHEFINKSPTDKYKFYIGTDSQKHTDSYLFVTVIAILRESKGGIYFYHKKYDKDKMSFQERIFNEASLSLDMASNFLNELKIHHFDFCNQSDIEIHTDVGTRGKTKEIIKAVTGMIIGSGYKCKTKPDSFVASSIADKYTK